MFEFGKDLRWLFAQARESEDLSWLELVPVNLVESEARQQMSLAGRMACPRPAEAWLRAAALWREHARRSGRRASLERAARAGRHAATAAPANEVLMARVRNDAAKTALLTFDLCGDPQQIERALAQLDRAPASRHSGARWTARAVRARLHLRQAQLSGRHPAMIEALTFADEVLNSSGDRCGELADELRLDRAAFALETGMARRDPTLLDQAGRDLRSLIDDLSPDARPLSRARALALCGKGLSALAAGAHDETAHRQGAALYEAAADQFTPDHSPLDWAAIILLRGDGATDAALSEAVRLTRNEGLVLGALVREQLTAREISLAEQANDSLALDLIEGRLRRGIKQAQTERSPPLDWAADQIALALLRLARARLSPVSMASDHLGLMLTEAAQTAREQGVHSLADRAEQVLNAASPDQRQGTSEDFNWNMPR